MFLIFTATPSLWREVIRQEAFRDAQYHVNRRRQRVTAYHRPHTDESKDRWYFRLPG